MLRRLEIRNFKAAVAIDVQFEPLTVLVGPNGAGKSTILQAIDMLGWLVTGDIKRFLEVHRWEYSDLPHLRSATARFGVTAHLDLDGPVEWLFDLGARRRPHVAKERLARDGTTLMEHDGRRMWRMTESGEAKKEQVEQSLPSSWLRVVEEADRARYPTLYRAASWARGIRGYFFLDPLELRSPNRESGDEDERHEIGLHGGTLAPFLGYLARERPDAFRRVVERVRRYYPSLKKVEPKRRKFGWTHIEIAESWNGESASFNARQVSDGLLRLLAVSAMHELPSQPSVLLLDELENGLHPRLVGGLLEMLRSLVESRPGRIQVVAATHSPLTVNHCQGREVQLVTRGPHGDLHVSPMDETKNFERLRRHFDLGELWYNVGEERLTAPHAPSRS
ncbi:MAG: AAA family ATPase [Myxococcales bacterium]